MDSEGRKKHGSTSPDIRTQPQPGPFSKDMPEIKKDALLEQRSSVPASFFALPSDVRINIYRRVLVVAHPLYLFQDGGSQVVENFAPEKPFRWLALLYTNRQVHEEASMVLYGFNHFQFMDTTQHQGSLLQSFFNSIGSVKAGLLTHLSINFPVVERIEGQPGFSLREDDLCSLQLLREKCNNLTTLEILIHSQKSRLLNNPSRDDSQFIQEALSQIDAQLKAITSLNNIIVRSYDGTPTSLVMEFMQGFGWVISTGR